MGYQPDQSDGSLMRPITSKEDLKMLFRESYKQPDKTMIGMEVEEHGIHTNNYKPISYSGKNGVRQIQNRLVDELGWQFDRQEGRYATSMSRSGTHLTLESGEAMSELSGRVHSSIHDLVRELRLHQGEFSEISKMFKTTWLGIGFQPFARSEEIKDVMIQRFTIGRKNRYKASPIKDEIWRRIASLQSNVDYVSEEDACKKFQTLIRCAPFVAAMFAHAPFKEGKLTDFVSYRLHRVRKVAPECSGIRRSFLEPDFNFDTWTDFCMDMPMVAIVRDGEWIPIKGITFRKFLKSGYEDFTPLMDDWMLHVSFVYTDARIKSYIELRVCDSLPPLLIPSMQAFVKAFVYHEDGEKVIKHLTKTWTFDDFDGVYDEIAKVGMNAEVKGKKLLDSCKELLEVATDHLQSMAVMNEKNEDESIYLAPIKEFVMVKEKCPGAWVAQQWEGEWNRSPDKLIDWCSFQLTPS